MSNKIPFQDHWDHNLCWGCGAHNPNGLNIKSYWSEADSNIAICRWTPCKEHMAGPKDILNGGVIATVIDCHSIGTAIADAYVQEGRELNSEPLIWFVTGYLNVNYHKPTPIDCEVELRAKVTKREGKKSVVACTLFSGETQCVGAEVLAIRVPPENWYP